MITLMASSLLLDLPQKVFQSLQASLKTKLIQVGWKKKYLFSRANSLLFISFFFSGLRIINMVGLDL